MNKYAPFKPRTADLIESLISEFQWLSLLKNTNKPYTKLINLLIDVGQQLKSNNDFFLSNAINANQLADMLGVKYNTIRRWLFLMYDDILELNSKEPQLFNNGGRFRYNLSFETLHGYYDEFNLWTSVEIDIHNTFNFKFIKAKLGEEYFFQENMSITHIFNELIYCVSFQRGFHNEYRRLVTDKSEYLHAIKGYSPHQLNRKRYEFDEEIEYFARSLNTGI